MEDPGRAEWEAMKRNEAAQREAALAAETARRNQEMENNRIRIEAERVEAKRQNDALVAQLETQRRALEDRRTALEAQRIAGTIRPDQVSTAEVLRMFRDPQLAPDVKEYWATLLLVLESRNEEAKTFLRTVRGWSTEEIDGLQI